MAVIDDQRWAAAEALDGDEEAEIAQFRAQLSKARDDVRAAERAQADALVGYDSKLVTATEELDRKQRLMAAWDVQWTHFRALEQVVVDGDRRRFDARWHVEEEELITRHRLQAEEETLHADLMALASQKHRYLTESKAWCRDWTAAAEQDWRAYRAECRAKVDAHLTDDEALELEHQQLKDRLAKLAGRRT
jgi:hypothetical protein